MRKHVREDSAVSAAQRAFDEFADEEITFESNPAVNPPKVVRNRHTSMLNIQTTTAGAFVDILDAQSEIKPSDFRTRLRATGARDYGEDVADRNIVASPTEVGAKMLASPAITPLHLRRLAAAPQLKAEIQRPKTTQGVRSSEDPYQRTKSLNSATFAQFQSRSDGLVARTAGAAPKEKKRPSPYDGYHTDFQTSRPADRRQTLSTYESSQTRQKTKSGKSKSKPRPVNPIPVLPLDSRIPSRPGSSYQPRSANELAVFRSKSRSSSTVLPAASPDTPEFPKISTTSQKKKKKREPPTPRDFLEDHPRLFDNRPKTARPASRDSFDLGDGEFSPPSIPMGPSRHYSMTSTTTDFFSGRSASRDATSQWGRIDVARRPPTSDRTMTMPAAPPPHILLNDPGRQEQRSELAANYERTRSLVSMRERNRMNEIYDYIPMRTSSLRNWSLTTASTAPTTAGSVMSSNQFPTRPHTSHTANTSIDIPVFSPCMMVPTQSASSHSSVGTTVPDKSSYGYAGNNSGPQSPVTSAAPTIEEKTGQFNIDDYLSSEDDVDADSFVVTTTKQPIKEEESLLFNDMGYGLAGAQLPGLFDAIPETRGDSPPQLTTSRLLRHSSYSSPFQSKRHSMLSSFSGRSISTTGTAIRAAPGYGDVDSEDDLAGLDSDETPRPDLTPGRRGAKRISALGSMYGAIEEEKFEKIDVRTAVRRRKEAKQRKRDRVAAKKLSTRNAEYDEGNLADGEEAC